MSDDSSRRNPKPNKSLGRRIIISVITLLIILAAAIGLMGYRYFQDALKPMNPRDTNVTQVHIPLGASNKQIGSILQTQKIVKSGMVFDYYVKSNNMANFRAGYYQLKPSMSLKAIAHRLQEGGTDQPIQSTKGKVLVREGANINQIASQVSAHTDFTRHDFLKLMKDQAYIKQLAARYPNLLKSAMKAKHVRYRLEGYLYPATYEVEKNTSLKSLVEQMVAKTNQIVIPHLAKIKKSGMNMQQFMTLSSLIEREGVNQNDRRKMAGVLLNRIDINMPLQSDVAVLYAIHRNNKTLTNKDLQNDSPYNLYKYTGFGPGPFDSPSISSMSAVLHPLDRSKNYLYFVANTKTKKVYYSKTYAEHQQQIAKHTDDNN
ncbi:endolytic transglycosylase MltG [Lentilactobacillus kefiri]|uniref:Endolytic murein transglycosylase n=2 Tax=Lentilactobacillus kefiri TaxID=33962 RepID=A0A8E1RK94_LENKE|nr:endolytic transglycosylase MltG [Lentilactobacillus kefiri]KRL58732.1 aminodeoxychorismate lyase [Lentilactobacillus parakefiri DSM 10551]KRM53822.1 aminodeoxychorismate lyase [Lentilactobacillus kefiri DSM 20587 = JCM 5818]MCJ2161062.1 endolytic transglycosylase MltG [Lentilactobacillus kefiri]MDH5108209.1 endolytic transglycosylase MltG [Lentilactobacillus kefiri]MDM7492678.1 endolytic transglycosylase MltG [Lentilactobacillus kefiri]